MTEVQKDVAKVIEVVEQVADDPTVRVTISKVTPKISANARKWFYNIGVAAGIIGSAGPIVVAALTGEAAVAGATVVGLALTINSLLARYNLSKTPEEIAAG